MKRYCSGRVLEHHKSRYTGTTMGSSNGPQNHESGADTTTIEIVFRNYGHEEDLKPEELTAAFSRVGKLRLSPITPPMAGSELPLPPCLWRRARTSLHRVVAVSQVSNSGVREGRPLRQAILDTVTLRSFPNASRRLMVWASTASPMQISHRASSVGKYS